MIDLYQLSDTIQRISVLTQSDSFAKDYGNGMKYTSIEVHTVSYIADHPGCISGEIAYSWGKSTSAVSQIISKLKGYGLIYIVKDKENQKKQLLYLTKKGSLLDQLHRQFDNEHLKPLLDYLLERFDEKQIETMIQVLEAYSKFYCHEKNKK